MSLLMGHSPTSIEKPYPRRPWQPLMKAVDVINLDIDGLVFTASKQGIDCLIVNAGGFYCWYPSKLACQTINPYLTYDFLGQVTLAAHKAGIQVYGRVDIGKGLPETY